MHVLHKSWMHIDACICMRQRTWSKKKETFLAWKYSFLIWLLITLHLPLKSGLCVPFGTIPFFPLGTHHLVELTLVVAPGLMAKLNPWRFTPSCKHPSVWLHIPRDLPILLSFVLRSGCPLGIIHPSRIRPSEWMSYLIGTVPTVLFSPLTRLVITYLSSFICTKELMQMLMLCHAW